MLLPSRHSIRILNRINHCIDNLHTISHIAHSHTRTINSLASPPPPPPTLPTPYPPYPLPPPPRVTLSLCSCPQGATTCPTCVNIAGIAPLVPIVPSLMKEMHRQFMSYGGWTFAFEPYINVNLTSKVDSPEFTNALRVIDPMFYGERLKRLPKFVVLSSDDEFMQFDWSNIWWNDLTGEKHLTIINNAEHSLATGIPEVLVTLSNAIRSIAVGHQAAARPSFTHSVDNTTGAITVKVTGTHNKV